ncbi:MAG: GGDEF domain-containing protein [bacterium]
MKKNKQINLLYLFLILFIFFIAFFVTQNKIWEFLSINTFLLFVFILQDYISSSFKRFISTLIFSILYCFILSIIGSDNIFLDKYLFFKISILLITQLIIYFFPEQHFNKIFDKKFLLKKEAKEALEIQNKNLIKQKKIFEKEFEEMEDIYELTKDINTTLNFDKTMNFIKDAIHKFFNFTNFIFFIFNEEKNMYEMKISYNLNQDILDNFVKISNQKCFIDKYLTDSSKTYYFVNKENFLENTIMNFVEDTSTFLIIPIFVKKKAVSFILGLNFSKKLEQLKKMQIIILQISIAFEKAFFYNKIEKMSLIDGLTGLYNRRYFQILFENEIQRCKRYKLKFCLLYLDLDNFKQCNDVYGHLIGDMVLKEVGKIIKINIDKLDIVARYGGEEFLVILVETDINEGLSIANCIRESIQYHKFGIDTKFHITISIGISSFPQDGISGIEKESLLNKADALVHLAKKNGKNCVESEIH